MLVNSHFVNITYHLQYIVRRSVEIIITASKSTTFTRPTPEYDWSYAITLAMSAKRTKARWVVYELHNGEFIRLSQLFPTKAQAEKEREKREKLTPFTFRKSSPLGVGVVAKG